MHATVETHTRVCVSPAGVQKKRMQIKQSVFFTPFQMGNDWNIFFFFFFMCDLLNRLIKNEKKEKFLFKLSSYKSSHWACRKCAESSLLPRFVHVSFSWWIDRLIVPGNVLPPFSYSILDSSAPISGVIKTHELFRFFLLLLLLFILFLTHKKST